MAKITEVMVPQKAPSLVGNVYVSTWRGIAVLKKWPRKRKKNRPAVNLEQEDWFRQANILTKYIDPRLQITAREAVKGTPLYPRDVQISLMRGRLIGLRFGPNEKLFSLAVRQEVSESLDVIGQTTGGILIRGPQLWDIFDQGLVGQVLTSQGPNQMPIWSAGGGGGSGIWEEVAVQTAPVAGAFDFTGLDLSGYRAVKIVGVDLEAQTSEGFMEMQVYDNSVLVTSGYQWAFQGYQTGNFTRNVSSNSASFIALTMTGTNWGVRPLTGRGANIELTIFNPTSANNRLASGTEVHEIPTGNTVSSRTHCELPISTALNGFNFSEPTNGIAAGQIQILGLQA